MFDESMVHEIRITLTQPHFWDTLSAHYTLSLDTNLNVPNVPLMAIHVKIDGTIVDSVAVTQKGFNSNWGTAPGALKKPLKLDFNDFKPGGDYDKLKSLNLNNGFGDPTLMHDVLAYRILRDFGVPAPRTAYSKVFINNEYWGLYILVESVNKTFLKEHFESSKGNLYKANFANLRYKGDMQSNYYKDFELKTNNSENDWSDLVYFFDILNNTSDAVFKDSVEANFNTEPFFRTVAVDIALNNWDSYMFHNRNFFVYNDLGTGKFNWIPWDYNLAFDEQYPFDVLQQGNLNLGNPMDPNGLTYRPLVSRTMANPAMRAQYLDLACELTQTALTNANLDNFIDQTAARIRPALNDDPNKFFPITNFDSSIVIGTTNSEFIHVMDSFPTPNGWIQIDTTIERKAVYKGLKTFIADQGAKFRTQLADLNVSCMPLAAQAIETSDPLSIYPNPASNMLTISNDFPLGNVLIVN